MTQLILCCPDGGDHPVEARQARVTVNEQAEAFIEFPCPACGKFVACPLEDQSALRLIALGVRAVSMHAPAEVAEIHEGESPLTPDDLLDFHLFLGRPDWLERFERELAGRQPERNERQSREPPSPAEGS